MKKTVNFECPYNPEMSCTKLNTATNCLDVSCDKCEHYNNGIIASRGTPVLEFIINLFKKIKP